MPVREGARRRVGGEDGSEPVLLRRACVTAAHFGTVAVGDDDVPGPQRVVVIALARVAGRRAKVAEVAPRARRKVLVIAGRRARTSPVPTPRWVVAARELGGRAPLIDV